MIEIKNSKNIRLLVVIIFLVVFILFFIQSKDLPPEKVKESILSIVTSKDEENKSILYETSAVDFNHNINESTISLESVQNDAVLGLIDLKQQCNCDITIAGGTEKSFYDVSYKNGNKLDILDNLKLNSYIKNNFSLINSIHNGTSGYRDTLGNEFFKENTKNYWEVTFNEKYTFTGVEIR